MLEESGDEEESNAIVNQVLDEIGIEISGKVTIVVRLSLSWKKIANLRKAIM